jgi:hypothetical protein
MEKMVLSSMGIRSPGMLSSPSGSVPRSGHRETIEQEGERADGIQTKAGVESRDAHLEISQNARVDYPSRLP